MFLNISCWTSRIWRQNFWLLHGQRSLFSEKRLHWLSTLRVIMSMLTPVYLYSRFVTLLWNSWHRSQQRAIRTGLVYEHRYHRRRRRRYGWMLYLLWCRRLRGEAVVVRGRLWDLRQRPAEGIPSWILQHDWLVSGGVVVRLIVKMRGRLYVACLILPCPQCVAGSARTV